MNNITRLRTFDLNIGRIISSVMSQRSKIFGAMIIGALLAFEIFNYSTTEFALNDVLGTLNFLGISWATILSIAFCGIDFAGVARLFTPQQGVDEPAEVWYLFGAWVLAAAMNATLTWWGVSIAIANHLSQGTAFIDNQTIQSIVPVFVAVMVWVIRILIIGTFSLAGDRMFGQDDIRSRKVSTPVQQNTSARNDYYQPRPVAATSASQSLAPRPVLAPASSFKPQPKPVQYTENYHSRSVEPTYHNLASNNVAEKYEDPR